MMGCNYHGPKPEFFLNNTIPYTVFKPSEEKVYDFELQDFYGNKIAKDANEICDYFSSGDYSVYIELDYLYNTISPKIKSNKINFKVIKPEEKELEEFEELQRIHSLPLNKIGTTFEDKVDAYINFQKKYPKSIYMERVIRLSFTERYLCNYRYDEEIVNNGLSFIDNFPDSRVSTKAIFEIKTFYTSKKRVGDLKELLNNLIQKYPGTRTQKYCVEILNKF